MPQLLQVPQRRNERALTAGVPGGVRLCAFAHKAVAALAVDVVFVRSPVALVVAVGVAVAARDHALAHERNRAAAAVLEHAYTWATRL